MTQTEANGSTSQCRIGNGLVRVFADGFKRFSRGQLVAAQVHGANCDDLAAHGLDHACIRFKLFIFARKTRAVHEQKLGAKEPDTVGTV